MEAQLAKNLQLSVRRSIDKYEPIVCFKNFVIVKFWKMLSANRVRWDTYNKLSSIS